MILAVHICVVHVQLQLAIGRLHDLRHELGVTHLIAAAARIRRDVIDGHANPKRMLNALSAARIGIYQHAYLARLVECLADDYPVLRSAMGVDAFEALARDDIRAHPSTSPNLNS